jgi:predicted small lipoprotein YifL
MKRIFYQLMLVPLLLGILLPLAACGKKGAPHPPGPDDKIIYPRTYPAED